MPDPGAKRQSPSGDHRSIEPMTAVDSAWLRMEEPANSMTITGLLAFEGPLDWETLRGVVRDRLARHDRFRARVRGHDGLGRPAWLHSPEIDLDHHLVRVSLPE